MDKVIPVLTNKKTITVSLSIFRIIIKGLRMKLPEVPGHEVLYLHQPLLTFISHDFRV